MEIKEIKNTSSLSSQIQTEDTIYEISGEFDLNGGTLTIPSNCILRFNGGKLRNGTLSAVNCHIESPLVKIFYDMTFQGDFLNGETFQIEWFVDKYERSFVENSAKDASP